MTQDTTRRLAAVWFAEIVAYADLFTRDEDGATRIVKELQRIARSQCDARGGRVVKLMGGGVLTVFDSVDGAVRAALSMRDAFDQAPEVKAAGVSIRIGLHLGDVTEGADGDISGDAVNTASRIEEIAEPGQVVLSNVAYQLLQQRSDLEVEDLGEHDLKGIGLVRLYAAQSSGEADSADLKELLQAELVPLQVLDVAGFGGMGEIYLARDPNLRRTLAVKVLRSEMVADHQARARFLREAQVIAGLSHPNVISIHSVGELKDGTPYFVMDYIEGGSLADRLEQEGPLSIAEAQRTIGEVASALQAAHARGVVHRDIKASNILFDAEAGRALVTDWGIAALDPAMDLSPDTRLTQTGMVIGSPRYMSPEQLAGDDVGPETDIYSLGLLAFELLTGEGPFPSETPRALMIAHLREDPPKLSDVRDGVEPELDMVVARCLDKTPAARPTAEDVAQRFAPGSAAVLEWPPPGLAPLQGQSTTFLAMAFPIVVAVVAPVVLAFAARLEWFGQSVVQDLVYGPVGTFALLFGVGALMLLSGAVLLTREDAGTVFVVDTKRERFLQRLYEDSLLRAIKLGYGWRTIVEVLIDRQKDLGNLIAGHREYAILDATARRKGLRRRLTRACLRWAALLMLPFSVVVGVYTVNTGIFGLGGGVAVGFIVPSLLWLASLRAVDSRAVHLARYSLAHRAQSLEVVGSQVSAWHAAFQRVAGPAVRGTGWKPTLKTWLLYQVATFSFAILTMGYVLSILMAMLVGPLAFSPTDFQPTQDRFERVRSAAALRLSSDPSVVSAESGRLVRRISGWTDAEDDWNSQRPIEESIADSPLRGTILRPPYTLSVLSVIPASLRGISQAEKAYLAGFTGDPRFPLFERLARALEYDPGAPERYPADMVYFERPAVDLDAISEVAYHKLAQAGLQASNEDYIGAEETLREIFSVGLLLAEGSNDLSAAIVGRNVATLGLDALGQFFRGLGRDAEAATTGQGPGGVGRSLSSAAEPPSRWRERLERSSAIATDSTTVRAIRFEILAELIPAFECTNLDGIIFGLSPELKALVAATGEDLVRFPVDEAYFDMATQSSARLHQRLKDASREEFTEIIDSDLVEPAVFRFFRLAGKVFRNPRLISCRGLPSNR